MITLMIFGHSAQRLSKGKVRLLIYALRLYN